MGRLPDTDAKPLAAPADVAAKHCSKCHQAKPLTPEFWPVRNDRRNAFRGVCRQCDKAKRQAPEYKRREKLYQLRYYIAHRAERIAANRRYKLRNHDYWLEYARRWNRQRCIQIDWSHNRRANFIPWQRDQTAQAAIEQLQATLPEHLATLIDIALSPNCDDAAYQHIVQKVREFLDHHPHHARRSYPGHAAPH